MGSEAPIINRYLRLRKQVLEPSESALTFEGLIDALLVLYEECGQDKVKSRNELVSAFLAKFQPQIAKYHKLRVNIGDFQVKRIIGRGNFGDVKLAKEKSTGHVYALKVMKKNGDSTSAFFSEERDIMARSSSPWLTKLDYAFQDSGYLYLAMEYHCGGDLLRLMDERKMDEAGVRFYTAEVALGIHDLHKMGFVHRDIKPENILIDRTGHVKLADFGNAARLSTSGSVSKVMPVGTPDYIAPEVLQCLQGGHCKSDSHGAECDYWSLGVLAYEMFFGVTPFNDLEGSVINTYSNIMIHDNKVKFPDTDGSQASKELRSLIEGLLQPADKRLGHSKMLRHAFFSSLDWAALLTTTPPYVPDVSSAEDDSHFDIIEEVTTEPSITALKDKKEFKNLPFIGFSFTSDKESIKCLEKGDSGLEAELKKKASDLEKIKLKNFQLEQQVMNHTRVAEHSMREFEQVEKLTTQLNIAEQDNGLLKASVANLERILDQEKQDRAETEQRTLELLNDVRKKWTRAEEERMEKVKGELGQTKEAAAEFESQYRSCASELKKCKGDLEAVTNVKVQLKNKLKDYKQRLENVAKEEDKRAQKIASLESEKVELNTNLAAVHSQLDESRTNDGKVDALQLIIEQRDQILAEKDAELRIKITEMESCVEKSKAMKKSIKELEVDLKTKTKEIDNLKNELETTKNETLVETDAQLSVQAQLKNEIKEIMAENAELKSKSKQLRSHKKDDEQKIQRLEKEKEVLSTKLDNIRKGLRQDMENQDQMYKEKLRGLEKVLETLQARIEELQGKRGTEHELETKNELLEKEKVRALREKNELVSEKDHLNKVIEKNQEEKSSMVKDLENLKAEIKSLKENQSVVNVTYDNDEFISLKADHTKLQNELKEVKLDLRIERNEVKKKSDILDFIRERESKNKDKIEKLEKEKATLESEIENSKQATEAINSKLESVKTKEETFEKRAEELRKIKEEEATHKMEIRKLKNESTAMEEKMKKYDEKIGRLEAERKDFANLKINNLALTEVSTELEKQVIDYEAIHDKLEKKIEKIDTEKREAVAALDKEKEETRKAKIAVNEEKSTKLMTESKLKDLKRRLADSEKEVEDGKKSHENHINEYKNMCKKLTSALDDMTKDNADKEQFGKLNERAKSFLEVENNQLKEELAEKTTQLHSHKESNFKLSQGIEEACEKIGLRNEENEELRMKLETEGRMAKEKQLRLEATQAQQTKLIDFLQNKVAAFEGRKKTFADKLFGNKENRTGNNAGLPVAYGELETILEKERSKNKKLAGQLDRARAEVVALKTAGGGEAVPRSVLARLDSGSATHSHNIPHRLTVATSKRSSKCAVCQEGVSLLSQASQCRDCGVTVHQACGSSLPNTCGLSSQLAALQSAPGGSGLQSRPLPPAPTPGPAPGTKREGRVQVLVGGQWVDRVIVLRDTGVLDIYTEAGEAGERVDQLALTQPHCRVSLQSSVSYGEVHYINTTDRPYTFKLSLHSLGRPEQALYFMCQNFSAKVDWVNKLEEQIKSSPANLAPVKTESSVARQLVCSLPPPEEVLAAVVLDGEVVVGTSQGLAVVREGVVVASEGLQTPVHLLHHLPSLHLLVLATGGDGLTSQLVTLPTRPLLAGLPLQPLPLQDLAKCHIFACTETQQGKVFLCAANDHLVTILEWSHKRGHFVLRNKFSTDQPTKTIHFTDHSVLVGTSKFYEIDLKNFSAEEFLDLSHPGIQKSVASSDFKSSAPHSVMELPGRAGEEQEYALAFTRIILFVDSFGQETREPFVFEKLPVEHKLVGNVLVTSFCDAVQFISLENPQQPGQAKLLPCYSPHLVNRETRLKEDLLYSCQDTASNNLMAVSCADLELHV